MELPLFLFFNAMRRNGGFPKAARKTASEGQIKRPEMGGLCSGQFEVISKLVLSYPSP